MKRRYLNPHLLLIKNFQCKDSIEPGKILFNEDQMVLCNHPGLNLFKEVPRWKILSGFGNSPCTCIKIAESWLAVKKAKDIHKIEHRAIQSCIGNWNLLCPMSEWLRRLAVSDTGSARVFLTEPEAATMAARSIKPMEIYGSKVSLVDYGPRKTTETSIAVYGSPVGIISNVEVKLDKKVVGSVNVVCSQEYFQFLVDLPICGSHISVPFGLICQTSPAWLYVFMRKLLLTVMFRVAKADYDKKQKTPIRVLNSAIGDLTLMVSDLCYQGKVCLLKKASPESVSVLSKVLEGSFKTLRRWLQLRNIHINTQNSSVVQETYNDDTEIREPDW